MGAAEYRERVWKEEEEVREESCLVAYNLPELLKAKFPARPALLCRGDVPVFRQGHLGELYSPRGFGKTWLLQTLALVAAAGVEALGFRAPEPCNVLLVDGEMGSEEQQARWARLCEMLGAQPTDRLSIIGADWQEGYLPRLDTVEGQAALEPHAERADLLLLDNRSCLFDPEAENDPVAWQPAQDWLLSLRRRGKGVILAHHSNRMGGARGHSKPEDAMDVLLKLSRPTGYVQDQGARFLLEWDKARGVHGPAVAPFIASLTERGWIVEGATEAEEDTIERRLIDYLVVADKVGEPPKTASAAVRGAGLKKAPGLSAFAKLLRSGRVKKAEDGGLRVA